MKDHLFSFHFFFPPWSGIKSRILSKTPYFGLKKSSLSNTQMETEDKGLAALIIHLAGPLIWFLRHQREKPNPTFGKETHDGNAAWRLERPLIELEARGRSTTYWPKELTRANQLVELTEMQARVVLPLLIWRVGQFVVLPDRCNLFASRTTSFTQGKDGIDTDHH